jgi:hypothetical protein
MAGAALTVGGSGTKRHRRNEAEWRVPPFGEFARMGMKGTVKSLLSSLPI